MTDRRPASTLGDRLATGRRRHLVGRAAELGLFDAALAASSPPFAVLHVHGPAGIGKTSLLEMFAISAQRRGVRTVQLDAQQTLPTPDAVLGSLDGPLRVPADDGPILLPAGVDRVVITLDTYERLAPLDDWFRTQLLPRLPASTISVTAGRRPPAAAWRADPAWRDLLRVVEVRNLGPDECRDYLLTCGVDADQHSRLIRTTHGHPLALALVADVMAGGGRTPTDPMTPDLVSTLLRRFVDATPGTAHRRALEVCAIARVTTEALLRDALNVDDAHELFAWLGGLSFVTPAADGLELHELARDVLDVDLRWRDPDRYRQTFTAVRSHVHRRLDGTRGAEQRRAILDEKYLFRNLPSILSPVDWESWGRDDAEPARPADRDTILALVDAAEGEESAAIAERWLDHQPEAFHVLRRDGVVTGLLGLIDLTAASADDITADPAARSAWSFAQAHGPTRPGEHVTQTRFVIDRDAYQDPSATLNAVPVVTLQRYLQMPRLAWDFLTLAEPDRWNAYFAVADLPRAEGADVHVGGRRYGLFAHDFRALPVSGWLDLVTERALTQDLTLPPPSDPGPVLLSEAEFTTAVRQGLRDLQRSDLLARNPLVRSRLVRERAGDDEPDGALLGTVLHEAVDALRDHPRDDKLLCAIERTYLRPAATQERAAEALGLPFSTYRRHLTQGITRIVELLWRRELNGAAHPPT